jgi:peptide deformylase
MSRKKRVSYNFKIILEEQTPEVPRIENIEVFIKENEQMLMQFLMFASKTKKCAGLAANQVSLNGERINKRFFAYKDEHGFFRLIINPDLFEKMGDPIKVREGCLTWPGRIFEVERYDSIAVEFYSLDGEKYIRGFSGYTSQIWQHEIDHLNGVEEKIY